MTVHAEPASRSVDLPTGLRTIPVPRRETATVVSVVSPEPVVRAGLAALMVPHPERVLLTPFTTDASALRPEVVLYDSIGLTEDEGRRLDVLVALPATAVLVLSRDLRPDLGALAMARGADAMVTLAADVEEILDGVDAARRRIGRPAPVAAPRLGHEVGLTPREVDVLRFITAGMTNQEIAETLFVSINSVKTYIRSAYRRIGAKSRPQAVVWCLHHGFPTEQARD
jgi:DNA-binding NarL/FixJ family response regulator